MSEIREAAFAWAHAGFCVLPLRSDGSKSPDVAWRCYNQEKDSAVVPACPSLQIVDRWFAQDRQGLGLIMGAVSGNAEMFEFEGRALDEGLLKAFVDLMRVNGAGDLWDKLNSGYLERTPSGGLHFIYRVDGKTKRNVELARRPATDEEMAANPKNPIRMLIEAIGEGGHTIVAPSSRGSHPTGKPWVLLKGEPGQVVTLTEDERDRLYAVARMLDTVPEYVRTVAPKRERSEGDLLPGDDFAARTDWSEILEPEGWTYINQKGDYAYWLRPGKETAEGWGCSASTGGGHDGQDFLRVWSTSTTLEANVDHSKFFVWAHYNAGGDMAEAARSLREQGYGSGGEAVSRVVAGDTNPFSDGFDPMAWAKERAANNRSAAGAVPTVGPINPFASDLRADDGGGQLSSEGDSETPADHAEGEFQALDWRALAAENYVEEWVVEGFLGARRAMALYSAPKLGKSLLMLEMAARVSRGELFMGRATKKATVLYFDHENDPRSDTWPRLKAMGFTPEQLDNLKVLSFPSMASLDTEAGGTALMRAVAQFDAGLVIIDTVSRTIEGEENDNNTWLKFFDWTGKVLKKAEIPYVRLDHSGKDESRGQRGGSAKSGDVDIICQLVKVRAHTFALRMDGSRQKLEQSVLGFKRLDGPLRSEMLEKVEERTAEQAKFDKVVKARMALAKRIVDELRVPDTRLTIAQLKAFGRHTTEGSEEAQSVIDDMVNTGRILQVVEGKSTLYEFNFQWKPDPVFGAPED